MFADLMDETRIAFTWGRWVSEWRLGPGATSGLDFSLDGCVLPAYGVGGKRLPDRFPLSPSACMDSDGCYTATVSGRR
ncbi:hypothetical protein K227x_23670 [Rubripirellula lacrimiformis]|uniref:Uncharacterized protein n=1 Tax=Rubripirellula lacrimiformis TaxID=1930273 RepID=A0A517NA22_9BACT|nr:hypothetical protein K227x_23670 [Rubripirellula lacrimiformis]